MSTYVESPTIWIYTQKEGESGDSATLYFGWGQIPGKQDRWCLSLWDIIPTSIQLYRTDIENNQGIDVDSNLDANKF